MHRFKVLVSSYHMNQVLQKYKPLFKKKKIKVDSIIRNPVVKENELLKIISNYHGIICSDDELSGKVLKHARKLKVISKWGTGIDSIDKNYALSKGIKVFNSPGAFTESVAQHAWSMILALSRKLVENDISTKRGEWKKFQGFSIENKNLGIVGLGKIGRKICQYAKGFGVNIYGNDIDQKVIKFHKKRKIKIVPLKKLIQVCDIIILAVDLNKKSYHLIDKKELSLFNQNKILINISRGPVVNNLELVKSLTKKNFKIGFDVFEKEPLNKKILKKLSKKNCILTSHNAFNSDKSVDFVNQNTINNLLKGLLD
jgi:D-3-phosphoglycerate dehydrogenase